MNRREFLKSLGAAMTVAAFPVIAGDPRELVLKKRPKIKDTVYFESEGRDYALGYDLVQDFTWMRVTYRMDDGEWYDMVRQRGYHLDDPQLMLKSAEMVHARFLASRS